jgi:hypothetical protein
MLRGVIMTSVVIKERSSNKQQLCSLGNDSAAFSLCLMDGAYSNIPSVWERCLIESWISGKVL